jgi:DNA-binding beta-propeller fold protein YncE
VFVADTNNHRIQQFQLADPCLKGVQVVLGVCFINEWGSRGNGTGEFLYPYDVTVDSTGHVFVADTYNHRIQQFQLANLCPNRATQVVSGVCFIKEWGSRGIGKGQFEFTGNVAVDSSGNVFVSDVNNHRIQLFKFMTFCPSSTKQIVRGVCYVTEWGTGISQFQFVPRVAVDSLGHVYAVDKQNNRVQKFQLATPCPSGTLLVVPGVCHIEDIGMPGSGIGQLSNPWGLAVYSPGYLFVADTNNNRIQIFKNDNATLPPISSHLPK